MRQGAAMTIAHRVSDNVRAYDAFCEWARKGTGPDDATLLELLTEHAQVAIDAVVDALLSDRAKDAAGYALGGEHATSEDRQRGEAVLRAVVLVLSVEDGR